DASTWNPCNSSIGYCLPGVTGSQLMSYGAAVSTSSMFAGEFGALYPALQGCSALDTYSYGLHLQSIALDVYPPDIGTFLQANGCATSFFNKVGTRIELRSATFVGNPGPGGTLHVTMELLNAGYGRVIRQRPATLMFLASGSVMAQVPIALS